MAASNRQIMRKGFAASIGILLSHVLGLVRDMMMSRLIGGGAAMSAWIFAFTVPNLFRRLFGEGEAARTIVPIISFSLKNDGKEKARADLGTIAATLTVILGVISVLGALVGLALTPFVRQEQFHLALWLAPILMPYTLFICLTGVFAGVLNRFERFFLPSLTSVIMNVAMIAALLWRSESPRTMVYRISWAILISGVLQLAMTIFLLKKEGMSPLFFRPRWRSHPAVNDFVALVLPGIVGASAYQINTLMDRAFAGYAGPYAAPALYYSERLVYLPVGIFAVAIGNACLAYMSKTAAESDRVGLAGILRYGLRQVLFISCPMALFMLLFREPILRVFYSGAKFGDVELREAAWAMLFYTMGIPLFGAIKILVSGYYSRKDTRGPMKIAMVCVAVNFLLNCALIVPMKQGGIALATVISALVNVFLLRHGLKKALGDLTRFREAAFAAVKVSLIAAPGLLAAFGLYHFLGNRGPFAELRPYWRDFCALSLSGGFFVVFFLGLCAVTRLTEFRECLEAYAPAVARRFAGYFRGNGNRRSAP